LLGLLDEYIETDANAKGSRDAGEQPAPDSARLFDPPCSPMAIERGGVLVRHIEIFQMHGAAGPSCGTTH
jgi:hypothetical protein